MEQSVGSWARGRFGERAAHVRAAVVEALQTALANAQDAHKEGKSRKLYTFGSTQAVRRYECVVEALKEMDGAEVVKPKGSPHELVVLNGNLLYPFRYAKVDNIPIQRARVTDRRISALIAELFRCFGPEPSHEQTSLFDAGGDGAEQPSRKPVLTRLPPGTRLVLIAYASNDRAGVLNAWWGEGELLEGGYVRWLPGRYEQLPLSSPVAGGGDGRGETPSGPLGSVLGPRRSGPAAAEPRFDDGVMPSVSMMARPPIERENSELFPPSSERVPDEPKADDEER